MSGSRHWSFLRRPASRDAVTSFLIRREDRELCPRASTSCKQARQTQVRDQSATTSSCDRLNWSAHLQSTCWLSARKPQSHLRGLRSTLPPPAPQQWGGRLLWPEPRLWAEGTGFEADAAGITLPLTDMKFSFLSLDYILLKRDALLFTFPKCFQNTSDLKLFLMCSCQSGLHHPPIGACNNHKSSQNHLKFHLLHDEAFCLNTHSTCQRAYNGPPCAGYTGALLDCRSSRAEVLRLTFDPPKAWHAA